MALTTNNMNNIKTPGEVAYLAYSYNKWSACPIQDQWHNVASAVIAHHEAQKAQHWTLPAPPPGREWHRNDWTEDMLPDGWRPLLKGEVLQKGDQLMGCFGWDWVDGLIEDVASRMRTRRPLPPTNTCKINLPPLTLKGGTPSIGGVVIEKGPQP